MSSNTAEERLVMSHAGAIVIAVAVDAFTGLCVADPTIVDTASSIHPRVLASLNTYVRELVTLRAEQSGGDIRDLASRIEEAVAAWLDGHSGSRVVPLISVTVTSVPE